MMKTEFQQLQTIPTQRSCMVQDMLTLKIDYGNCMTESRGLQDFSIKGTYLDDDYCLFNINLI